MAEEDKDDESFTGGAFDNGYWVWDDGSESLVFMLYHPLDHAKSVVVTPKVPISGAVHFKELDLIEQMRFRKRYLRKLMPGQRDVISLQDVKDLVIYTAPLSIMSSTLINALHVPTTEKFMRALILYCQYYLQVAQDMSLRMAELDKKIRTPAAANIENEFRNDLCDLRCLVAKEYSTLLIGGMDTKKFHHMGFNKKKKSLSDKDARFIESLILVSIQIVWIALGRRSYNQLELEINRLLKTDKFNSVEHRLKTRYYEKLSPEERNVLLGNCLLEESKVHTRSPLIDEVICNRQIDYRMFGLGIIKYKDKLPPRLEYMLAAVAGPEEDLVKAEVTVGILGLPRCYFDTALYLLPRIDDQSRAKRSGKLFSSDVKRPSSGSGKSNSTSQKIPTSRTEDLYGYKDVVLPKQHPGEPPCPPSFPDEAAKVKPCSETQRRRWVNRLCRLTQNVRKASLGGC